jgi:hypothetical protein
MILIINLVIIVNLNYFCVFLLFLCYLFNVLSIYFQGLEVKMRVVQKFFIASLFMWAVPIAILYAFNHNLLPGKILKYLCFLWVCVFSKVGVDLYSYLCAWYFLSANLIERPCKAPLSGKMYVKMSYNYQTIKENFVACFFVSLLKRWYLIIFYCPKLIMRTFVFVFTAGE